MSGNNTLMVSGSDSHGTPVTVRAEQEDTTPQKIFQRFHNSFLETFQGMGILFDNFTSTDTDNHKEVVQDIFSKLLEKDLLYLKEQELLFDTHVKRFLPDRYVEGTCPKVDCGYENARGDQCDKCGSTLDALELINPKSKLSNTEPIVKSSEHFFLKLSHFNNDLIKWMNTKKDWRTAVKNFTLGQLNDGLKDRAITRDINWGIDIPLEGYDDKKIYVWFEAVLGYLSATIEHSKNNPQETNWEDFWKEESAQTVYFQGKDNVPFHAMILPAILLGYGGLNLPDNIPANQYVMMGGDKASSSRNTAIWVPDYLKYLSADQLRYYLTCIMPETSDSEFNWEDFVSRNNDELTAKWGNLVQRVTSFTKNRMENSVPEQLPTLNESKELKKYIEDTYMFAADKIEKVELRAALASIMNAAQETNKYLEKTEPWKKIKENKKHADESIYCALESIYNIAIMLYPFVPFSSKSVLKAFGNETSYSQIKWEYQKIKPGTNLEELAILYEKLELSEINKIFKS
tara:strand:+ start:812 stop:2359 length:1548 start_codon:yes stop_codon:yes gene_type:complete